jgi:hypothetical protein
MKQTSLPHILPALLPALLSFGCALLPAPGRSIHSGDAGPLGECAAFFESLDRRVAQAGVSDAGPFRVRGFPYARVNRFLASFHDEVAEDARFAAWISRMQHLDRDARRLEIANLFPPPSGETDSAAAKAEIEKRIVTCGELMKASDLDSAEQREALKREASVPDDYIGMRRMFGLYPLASLFVSSGVARWHAEARGQFSTSPPVDWRTIRYHPPAGGRTTSGRPIPPSAERDALGIPRYAPHDLEALFLTHAPVWEIRLKGDHDRIGAPRWSAAGALGVDTTRPVTYTLLSFTRFGSETLTQLNYVIWFPSRPKAGPLDLYGGRLDGVTYRVTLDSRGAPLLYETVHNCGCYYKAYPTRRLRLREKTPYREPPLILEAPEVEPFTDRATVAMEDRTHYVRHLYPLSRAGPSAPPRYSLVDYDRLRSLPRPGGHRKSMFDRHGIALGSERLERFLLWPTGVRSPGAMRQWGRHAVAFVGRRHFDDPDVMDNLFESRR